MEQINIRKNVLLVEDNFGDIRLIQEMIREIKICKLSLEFANDLNSAFEILDENSFDLILLDLRLPETSGIETVKKMLDKAPSIPIVILTGTNDQDLAIEAVKVGAEDYLVKGQIDAFLLERTINYSIERFHRKNELKQSEKKIRDTLMRANFYKDLFTHDMNNILQNILSAIDLSLEFLNKPESILLAKEIIKLSKDQINRGARLILNIRKLSQLEELEMQYKPIEIQDILKQSIKNLKNSFLSRNINVNLDISDVKTEIQANNLLEDVFDNLLTNSVQHNENSEVEINIKISSEQLSDKKYLRLEFKDNGVGIEDEWKHTIFLGYKEVRSLCRIGLGLSLVKKIIESYGGQIWIQDNIEGDYTQGSNFIILIPEVT